MVSDRSLVMAGDSVLSPLDADAADRVVGQLQGGAVDAVIAVDDIGQVLAAEVGRRLDLRHNPADAVRAAMDKSQTRRRLAAAAVDQPEFEVLAPGESFSCNKWPAVLKPVDRSGAQGVLLVRNAEEAQHALDRIRAIVGSTQPILAERFIDGPEVAVEGLLHEGHLDVLAIFDKPGQVDGPTFPETMLITPSRLSCPLLDRVTTTASAACTAIGLVEGPVHVELRCEQTTGVPHVLEVNPRSIGGLCSRSLRFGSTGTLEELVLGHALGLSRSTTLADDASGVLMLPVTEGGLLLAVEGVEAALAVRHVEDVTITAVQGAELTALPEGGDTYVGFIFARASTPDEVEAALIAAWSHVQIRTSQQAVNR